MKGLSEIAFQHFFLEFLKNNENKKEKLNKLGYDNNLFSFRSRAFNLTFHSDKFIRCLMKDALIENEVLKLNSLTI